MRKGLLFFVLAIPMIAQAQSEDQSVTCRNGDFASSSSNFSLAKVTVPRLYFLKDDEGCPTKGEGGCRQSSYVIKDDALLLARRSGNYVCAFYRNKGRDSAGWVALSGLRSLPKTDHPSARGWIGNWRDGDNQIHLKANPDASVSVKGDAYWPSAHPDPEDAPAGPNIGAVTGHGKPRASQLEISDGACKLSLHLIGDMLIAADNMNCGGANVSFSGVYNRTRRP